MKGLLHISLIMFCLFTAALAVQAQDNASAEYEITDSERERYERDKVIFSPGGEGETRYVAPRTHPTGSSSLPKDSLSNASPVAKPNTVIQTTVKKDLPVKQQPTKQIPQKQDDDAILSFNFLYYIIQKYKLQEIIE